MKPVRWYTFRRANVGSFFDLANLCEFLFWIKFICVNECIL